MSKSLFVRMFAGVPLDYFDAIPLIPFGQWLLTAGIFLLAVGFYAERDKRVQMLSLYRYGTVPGWWKRHFWESMAFGIKTAALLLFIVMAWDMVMGNAALSPEMLAEISSLWLLHSVSMAALFVLLDLVCSGRFVPGMLFLLEGVTFIIGWRVRAVSPAMYGMWGMYLQSSFCESEGFPAGVILTVEVILPAAGFWIGREYLRKETDAVHIEEKRNQEGA